MSVTWGDELRDEGVVPGEEGDYPRACQVRILHPMVANQVVWQVTKEMVDAWADARAAKVRAHRVKGGYLELRGPAWRDAPAAHDQSG